MMATLVLHFFVQHHRKTKLPYSASCANILDSKHSCFGYQIAKPAWEAPLQGNMFSSLLCKAEEFSDWMVNDIHRPIIAFHACLGMHWYCYQVGGLSTTTSRDT